VVSHPLLYPSVAVEPEAHHHPWLYATGRHGCGGECQCGGRKSRTWTSIVGVHLEFGRHLVEASR
jgi:hypothetical protein